MLTSQQMFINERNSLVVVRVEVSLLYTVDFCQIVAVSKIKIVTGEVMSPL